MTGEKLPPIGRTFTEAEWEGRDAVHVAIVPVVAPRRLFPAQHVNAQGLAAKPFVGVVDPYLTEPVEPGQRAFVFLYPRSVTSLRHVWTHPAFEDER